MNYRRLGDYIIEKVEFNEGDRYKLLQGVSNNKYFQKAQTNTIGIDLSKYRVAHYNQFVFNRATTRNGDKISIALRKGESCIVSPSYRIFEVKDENVLNPDYLLMWFKRPEFDRYARFKSHGSAHEFFDMEEMNEVELPIPSIEKQREIVAHYQAVENKIKVNEQICEKLEATAQALYKHWFVDFEFPDVKGKPYKSSGGKMVWNEELEKEVPEGWEVKKITSIAKVKHGYAFLGEDFSEIETEKVLVSPGNFKISGGFNFEKNKFYLGEINKNYILKEKDLVVNMTDLSKAGDTLGNTAFIPNISFKILLHNQRVGLFCFDDIFYNYYIYLLTQTKEYKHYILGTATGTTVRHTSPDRICDYDFLKPNQDILIIFNNIIEPLLNKIGLQISIKYKLTQLKSLLLSRLARLAS